MRKLILEEDEFIEDEPLIRDMTSSNLVTTLIKHSWESVDLFNSVALTLKSNGNENVTSVIEDIINSLYINIGQLEAILQDVNSQAEVIDDGKDKVDSDLGDVLVPEEDIEVEVEG